jgi:23S rRNA (uracil1939-C5)-methyltransferase
MTIDAIAAGGDGVGRADGLAVFVPRTAPGDIAQVAYTTRGRLGRGRLLQLLTPSPERVTPACPHYEGDRCGGCQLQHLNAATQQRARQHMVQDALARIGKRTVPLPSLTADTEWGYRGRLTLTLHRKGQGWIGGLHPHDDPLRVFPLETCLIAHPRLVDVWRTIRALLRRQSLADVPTMRLALRLDAPAEHLASDGDLGVALVLQGGSTWSDAMAFGAACGAAHAAVQAVWWIDAAQQPHALWSRAGGAPIAATAVPRGDEAPDPDANADFLPSADEALAFAQVNTVVATALRDRVYEAVQAFTPARVVDAYAGTGPLAERLAHAGIDVLAIEADRAGATAIVARLSNVDAMVRGRVRVVCDLVERALPASAAAAADVVVLNPPRRGVDPKVTAWLDAAPQAVRGVVYVSCNPATLARDLARLPAWTVVALECFDMFPQTAHVETVCVLQRTALGAATSDAQPRTSQGAA